MNGYRPQKTNKAAAPGRKHEVAVEMNDMQYQANDPPYTDFQGQLTHCMLEKYKDKNLMYIGNIYMVSLV